MLRFATYREDASEDRRRTSGKYEIPESKAEGEHALAQMEDAENRETAWPSRIESLAAQMAERVQIEEHEWWMPPVE